MTTPLWSRDVVEAIVEKHDGNVEAAAAELWLPVDVVKQALQPAERHCCPAGENLGVPVCDDCDEFDRLIRSAYACEHGEIEG